MWEDGWRPFTEADAGAVLPFAPPTVLSLIARCWRHDPDGRPSFAEIMDELAEHGPVSDELGLGLFRRKAAPRTVEGARRTSLFHGLRHPALDPAGHAGHAGQGDAGDAGDAELGGAEARPTAKHRSSAFFSLVRAVVGSQPAPGDDDHDDANAAALAPETAPAPALAEGMPTPTAKRRSSALASLVRAVVRDNRETEQRGPSDGGNDPSKGSEATEMLTFYTNPGYRAGH